MTTLNLALESSATLGDLVGMDVPPDTPPPPAAETAPDGYTPITRTLELTEQQQEAVTKIQDWYQDPGQQIFRLFGFAGSGKALAHGSKVQTPDGPVSIEDIKVGDLVFGADGYAVPVTGVFPQGVRQAYRVTFRDGVSVLCDYDHLWNVQTAKTRSTGRPYKTMTTGEIMAAGLKFDCGIYRFVIPLCEPVQYPHRDLPVDPYVLGALIGDGTSLGKTPTLCISRDDRFIAAEVRRRLPEWAVMTIDAHGSCERHRITDPRRFRANATAEALRILGLAVKSPQRFIPADYLHASVEQRWDLLRGLMDTDGCSRGNRISFSTKSERLANDIMSLVQSLGGTAISNKTGRNSEYSINVKVMTCPFLLPRKATQWRPSRKNPPSRRIIDIQPAGTAEHTCVSVAATDGLFLTDHYVVTHNTTLAQHIVDSLGVMAHFAAYTGKAAYVLRSKGCWGASTIHSLIYSPQEKVRQHLEELRRKLRITEDDDEAEAIEAQMRAEEDRLATPDFILKEDSDLRHSPLLVLDEVSMVGTRVAGDLLSFGTKILCLGDPAQLPPVDGGGYFINAPADHLLTEIHRSALDSPVTRLATSVRQSPPGDRTLGMPGMDGDSGRCQAISRDELMSFDQVLVGTNKTRWLAIHLLRGLHGLTGSHPVPGDRVIGLSNSSQLGIFNGQQFLVIETTPPAPDADRIRLVVEDDSGDRRSLVAWKSGFLGFEGEKKAKREGRGSVAAMTFAQAITCHKSQGSQWDNVLVVDESWIFARAAAEEAQRAGKSPEEAAAAGHIAGQRWLYTSITRAAKRVVVIASPRGLPQ